MMLTLVKDRKASAPADVSRAGEAATRALLASQRNDGHWVFELEADCTIPAEYVLLRHYRGEPVDAELEQKIARYLRRIQGTHGGWPLFHAGAFDISASVKAYFALKLVGVDPHAPHMARARRVIQELGGLDACTSFTKIYLSIFGQYDWDKCPAVPAELDRILAEGASKASNLGAPILAKAKTAVGLA